MAQGIGHERRRSGREHPRGAPIEDRAPGRRTYASEATRRRRARGDVYTLGAGVRVVRKLLAVPVAPSTWRRYAYLILGGAIAVPFGTLGGVARTRSGRRGGRRGASARDRAPRRAVRDVELAAARALLDVPTREWRPGPWRGAAWFARTWRAGGTVSVLTLVRADAVPARARSRSCGWRPGSGRCSPGWRRCCSARRPPSDRDPGRAQPGRARVARLGGTRARRGLDPGRGGRARAGPRPGVRARGAAAHRRLRPRRAARPRPRARAAARRAVAPAPDWATWTGCSTRTRSRRERRPAPRARGRVPRGVPDHPGGPDERRPPRRGRAGGAVGVAEDRVELELSNPVGTRGPAAGAGCAGSRSASRPCAARMSAGQARRPA